MSEAQGPEEARRDWEDAYGAAPLRDGPFETMSGVPVDPVYGDAAATRARTPTRAACTRRCTARGSGRCACSPGFGTADDTNARFKELLRAGGTGLSTAFDMPTLMGRDSDDPLARGEVGRAGVAVDTLVDIEDLFAGIDLASVSTSMTINGPAAIVLAMYVAAAEKRGRRAARDLGRDDPERHPQGVPGAEGVHLPAAPVRAAGHAT